MKGKKERDVGWKKCWSKHILDLKTKIKKYPSSVCFPLTSLAMIIVCIILVDKADFNFCSVFDESPASFYSSYTTDDKS